jgi:hypothetical protein
VPEEGARVVLRALAASLGGQEVRERERERRRKGVGVMCVV